MCKNLPCVILPIVIKCYHVHCLVYSSQDSQYRYHFHFTDRKTKVREVRWLSSVISKWQSGEYTRRKLELIFLAFDISDSPSMVASLSWINC